MKAMILLITAAMLTMFACSGDESSSPEPDEEAPLVVDTLGTAGGTLETDDFALAVPAGAFSSPAELKLYESDEDHGFGDNSVSRFFRLEGLPEAFSESLTVRIRYQGTLTGETYVAAGTEEIVLTGGIEQAEEMVYRLLSASETSGYIEGKLPPQGVQLLSGGGRPTRLSAEIARRMDFVALANYGSLRTSEHFVSRYPLYLSQYANDLMAYFEAAHDTVVGLGIGYEERLWAWPAEIVVKKYIGEDYGHAGLEKEKPPVITLDEEKISEALLPDFEPFALIAMMDVAQGIPDPLDFWKPDNVWWHTAVMLWFVAKFGGPEAPTVAERLQGNEMKTLWGLPVGLGTIDLARDHGAAWSAIVDHLTWRYGDQILGSIYHDTRAGTSPISALLHTLPEPEYNWWPHFVDKYLSGDPYGVETTVFLASVASSDRFTIKTAVDTLWEVEKAYNQLSAQLHRIIPDYALVDENACLELSVSCTAADPDYVPLLVYKEKNDVLDYVGEGDEVHVNDLQRLTIDGYEILAVVVNCFTGVPYSEKPIIKLTARVTSRPAYNWCRISMGPLSAHFTTDDDTDYWDEEWGIAWEGEGSFFENTFVATWNQRPNPLGEVCSGELTVVLDPATLGVTSLNASETCVSSLGYEATYDISGGDIPFHESTVIPNPYLSCRVRGMAACSKIGHLDYTLTNTESGTSDELDQWLCREQTGIYVTFWRSDDR